jgi:hypothetical protein
MEATMDEHTVTIGDKWDNGERDIMADIEAATNFFRNQGKNEPNELICNLTMYAYLSLGHFCPQRQGRILG